MKRKVIKIPVRNVLQYIQLFNGLLELTDKELSIMAAFITMYLAIKKTGVEMDDYFSAPIKKRVAKELGIPVSHLYVYMGTLSEKKAILKTGRNYAINPMLIPWNEEEVVFKIR